MTTILLPSRKFVLEQRTAVLHDRELPIVPRVVPDWHCYSKVDIVVVVVVVLRTKRRIATTIDVAMIEIVVPQPLPSFAIPVSVQKDH